MFLFSVFVYMVRGVPLLLRTMDSSFEVFTVFYLMFCLLLSFPPDELWGLGFSIEGFLSKWLGKEEDQFVLYNIRRTSATLLFQASFPLGYVLWANWMFPETVISQSLLWIVFTAISLLILTLAGLLVASWYYGLFIRHLSAINAKLFRLENGAVGEGMRLNGDASAWSWHPLALTLQAMAPALGLSSWRDVEDRVDDEYKDLYKFSSVLTSWNARTVITRSFIIRISSNKVEVAVQEPIGEEDGCRLELVSADESTISPQGDRTGSQYLNIQLRSLIPHTHNFSLRINAREFDSFRGFIRVPLHIPAGTIIQRSLAETFLTAFSEQVDQNPRIPRTVFPGELENCIGCYVKEAQVKLRKCCESAECMRCQCRPMWCVGCMGLWFAHQQDQQEAQGWMASRAPCPSCRSPFCMLDVCLLN